MATTVSKPESRPMTEEADFLQIKSVDHVHFYGFYIGNYPSLEKAKIMQLCRVLNDLGCEK